MGKRRKQLKVMVAVPCCGAPEPLCVETLFRVGARCRRWCALDVRLIRGYSCDMARNEAVRLFLEEGADYLWFVDSDIALRDDALERLLAVNAGVASGVYRRKEGTGLVEVCRVEDGETVFYNAGDIPEGVFAASGVGAGCLLLRRDVVEACRRESGDRVFVYSHEPLVSEDLWFCNLVSRLGYDVMVDGGLRVGHIGKIVY